MVTRRPAAPCRGWLMCRRRWPGNSSAERPRPNLATQVRTTCGLACGWWLETGSSKRALRWSVAASQLWRCIEAAHRTPPAGLTSARCLPRRRWLAHTLSAALLFVGCHWSDRAGWLTGCGPLELAVIAKQARHALALDALPPVAAQSAHQPCRSQAAPSKRGTASARSCQSTFECVWRWGSRQYTVPLSLLSTAGVWLLQALRPRRCCGYRGGKPAAPQWLHVLLSDDQRMRHWLRCWARAAALFPPRCPPPPNPTAALGAAPCSVRVSGGRRCWEPWSCSVTVMVPSNPALATASLQVLHPSPGRMRAQAADEERGRHRLPPNFLHPRTALNRYRSALGPSCSAEPAHKPLRAKLVCGRSGSPAPQAAVARPSHRCARRAQGARRRAGRPGRAAARRRHRGGTSAALHPAAAAGPLKLSSLLTPCPSTH